MRERTIQHLTDRLRDGAIDRRDFLRRAAALGVAAPVATMLAEVAAAQGATPGASPAASPVAEPFTSITREEYLAQVLEAYDLSEPQNQGGQLILVSTSDIGTLNPVVRSDVIALYAINLIFNYLATQSPVDGTMAPDLADYWEVAGDGMTYTFHLNKDARWHDGEPVTAHDVVMTFDAVMAENSISPLGSEFTGSVASHRAIDDYTYEIVSKQPVALFLEKTVAAIPIMPAHIWGEIPYEEWASSPGSTGTDPSQVVGSGPFRFTEWVLGDHVTVERNPDYWLPDQVPNLDTFTIRVITEPESAVQSVIAGESDTMRGMAPTQIERVEQGNPDVEIVTYDTMSWMAMVMNGDPERNSFFADVEVRRALQYAVDRELIVEQMLNGLGTPAVGVQPPTSPAYAPDRVTTVYTYDPDKAREMLEAAGWVDEDGDGIREKDGVRFSVEYPFGDGVPVNEQLVPYITQMYGEVGVEVTPAALPIPTLNEQIIGGNYDLSSVNITWTLDDLGVLYRCDAFPPAGFNLPRYCNPEYDRLNDLAIVELDAEKRRELIIEQGNISNDDAHWGLLYFGKAVVPLNKRVHNIFPSAFGELWSYPWVWLDAE